MPVPKKHLGFTLIELLIVVVILGVLGTFAIVSYPAVTRRARDTKRISDIKQYQINMELYANRNNGNYYAGYNVAINDSTTFCSATGMTGCQYDPRPDVPYIYSGSIFMYVVWATLERLSDSGAPLYFVACSDGRSFETTEQINGATCPEEATNFVLPI